MLEVFENQRRRDDDHNRAGEKADSASNANPIPLTLTLSHGEREQSAAGSVVREVRRADTVRGCDENQRRILPLPEGEGWGEGEADSPSGNRVGTSPEVC